MTNELLPCVLPHLYQGIQDVDDDVRAVAASALVPVVDNFVQVLPQQVRHNSWLQLESFRAPDNEHSFISLYLFHPQILCLTTC